MLYKSCRELPMHNFNEIQLTNDLSYLIKDGSDHSQEELQQQWIDILDERSQTNKDRTQTKYFRDSSELLFLETKLNILTTLSKLVYDNLNEDQKANYDKILKGYHVKDIEQAVLVTTDKLNLKISQFKTAYDNEKNSNFEDILASMRMAGYHVNRHEITVSEFDALMVQIKKQNKAQNARRKR